jgi:hypothetical protein
VGSDEFRNHFAGTRNVRQRARSSSFSVAASHTCGSAPQCSSSRSKPLPRGGRRNACALLS